jgi:D-alanyl-D-alanine carboxypeptidase/D-alanyl-D-alanine-endopeptidase (penicillin-binding protein 4)
MKGKICGFYRLIIYCLLFTGGNVFAQTPQNIKTFAQNNSLLHASISFKAIDLSAGKVIAVYNEYQSLTPASTMKIVSTAAALDFLHPNFRYKTPLSYSGTIEEKGTLTGNLYIAGCGDPTLGSEYTKTDNRAFLNEWLSALQKAGIKKINGSVIVLDQDYLPADVISPKWMWEDLGNYYAPGKYGISVFDNTYQLFLSSEGTEKSVRILGTKPEIDSLYFINNIQLDKEKTNDVYINGIPYSYERRLNGVMKANQSSYMVKGEIPDPGMFLAKTVSAFLLANEIAVDGAPGTSRLGSQAAGERNELMVTLSPPLSKIIEITNVKSNNHYAESLYRTFEKESGSDLSNYWEKKGINTEGQFLYDGSGLSPANAISAGFLTDILVYMSKKSKYSQSFYQSLPVAGRDGTVASFLKGTELEGKARIKSGSMTKVQSYAGYVEKGDKRFAFAIIVNNFTGKRADLKKEIEKLLVSVF